MAGRVPNFILAFIPAQINPNTLNTMTAFAVRTQPYVPAFYDIFMYRNTLRFRH